ncbi:uracil-DNA glycosylase [Saccharicrinis aurantiacus]|uniref:uracil-DNA glycosylase n=1 Tax=Saccharicrinis aurantiacus TaxID=1849719 RepID=UPI00094FE4DF|nr:uracil-DNA glycosylase [Saccharicrinis aurantiacus]
MDINIESGWKKLLQSELETDYFKQLNSFVNDAYQTTEIFPPRELIFEAFNLCPLDKTKVVILGQDPYHDVNQAHGLCFSVNNGIKFPPSLRNIFKELDSDEEVDFRMPENGNLEQWAKQGVLLLNATLTVEAHKAGSHQKQGWETFTDAVIEKLAKEKENIVFILWGAYARKKVSLIDTNKHSILESPHPSPLSAHRGFFGNKHFSKTNNYLQSKGYAPIIWDLPQVQKTLF